jgi:hypothetical protein
MLVFVPPAGRALIQSLRPGKLGAQHTGKQERKILDERVIMNHS